MAAAHFADAVATYDAARIVLFGVPYDRTCSFRGGSRFAPRAIREASYNFETFMMDHQRDLADVPVADLGDTAAYGPSAEMVGGVTKMASDIVGARKIPIVIGGEHSLAPAVVRAFPKDIGVIGIDAHLDFRDSYLNDPWSHACSARRIADHVGVEHVVYIGVRSYSREEREDLERLGLTYVSVYDVHERGIAAAVDRALKAVHRDQIYLTIDIDGVDPAFAPAVGNPEPFGLTPLQVKKLIGILAPHLVGMDLNEVSPAWDGGQTALLGARSLPLHQGVRGPANPGRICPPEGGAERADPELVPTRGKQSHGGANTLRLSLRNRKNVYVHPADRLSSLDPWRKAGAVPSKRWTRFDSRSQGPTSRRCGRAVSFSSASR
jgi:agmatinase